jgi:hypothetical protein
MVVMCIGCTVVVSPQEMENAENVCKEHGGVDFLVPFSRKRNNIVWCKDGIKISHYEKLQEETK